jgi:hypothetical protein
MRPESGDFQAHSGEPAEERHPSRFVNDAEAECARILDFHGIPWEYEPRSFVLEEDAEGRVLEAFTPDSASSARATPTSRSSSSPDATSNASPRNTA